MSGELLGVVARLEQVTSRLEGLAQGTAAQADSQSVSSEVLEEYDTGVLGGKLKEYFGLSVKLGGEVKEQSLLVKKVFDELRNVLVLAAKHKQPAQSVIGEVCKVLTSFVSQVTQFCEKRRSSKVFSHLMTVKEGIGCVGWVTVAPKPAPYIKECYDQALFYGNRVIKDFKGKAVDHVNWARAYTGAILDLQGYVKSHHTIGLVWCKSGSVLTGPPAAAAPGGPPPPPPPVIQPPSDVQASKPDESSAQKSNLLAALNKGGDVTQGLRKVTDDMKTHKNPELRASSVVKAGDVKPAKSTPKFGAAAGSTVKKPPVLELQNKKWAVEYQEDKSNLSVTDTNPKQTVYVFKCVKCTLKVSGKVNSIILDNCKRVAVCFDDVISSVEVINSQSIQVQMMGKCPTVSIDKTDGCQVYLSKASVKCEIITAKSSEMNICIPPPPGKQDFIERPVPEQFKTIWNGSALVTECTDITA